MSSYLPESTVVKTGFKAANSLIGVTGAKLLQAFTTVSIDNIKDFANNQFAIAEVKMKEIRNSCGSVTPDLNSVFRNLYCSIIKSSDKTLPLETVKELSAIINNYSNKEYVCLPSVLYIGEKTAAASALKNSALLTGALNLVTDTVIEGVSATANTAARRGQHVSQSTSDFVQATGNAPNKPPVSTEVAVGKTMISGVAGVAVSYLSVVGGIELFKFFNKTISPQYKPDFKSFISQLSKYKSIIDERTMDYNACVADVTSRAIQTIMAKDEYKQLTGTNSFRYSINDGIDPNSLNRSNSVVVDLKCFARNEETGLYEFTSQRQGSAVEVYLHDQIYSNTSCASITKQINDYKVKLDQVSVLLDRYLALFRDRENAITDKKQISQMIRDISPVFELVNIEDNSDFITNMTSKLEDLEADKLLRLQQRETDILHKSSMTKPKLSVAAAASAVSNIKSSVKKLFHGHGGKRRQTKRKRVNNVRRIRR